MWGDGDAVTRIWGLVVSKQGRAQNEARWDSTASHFSFFDELFFVVISPAYLQQCQVPRCTLLTSTRTHTAQRHIHSLPALVILCVFDVWGGSSTCTSFLFLNEKRWHRWLLSSTDAAATEQAEEGRGRKAMEAINKLVMRTRSGMGTWREEMCRLRGGGRRDGEHKWNRRREEISGHA